MRIGETRPFNGAGVGEVATGVRALWSLFLGEERKIGKNLVDFHKIELF